jgi:hypothetical protein
VLAIYFLLWVLGTRADAETQALVYLHVDNKGKLPVSAIGVIAALLIFATILLYSRNFEEFTLALAAFFIVNVLAWRYLVRFVVRPIISASRAIYAGEPDAVGSEKLTIVETLICGRWQLWRYFAGALVIAMLGGIAFLKHNGGGLPGLHPVVPWDLIQVFVMTLYVSVMEIWIWWERLRARVSLELLDDLGERYILRAVSN